MFLSPIAQLHSGGANKRKVFYGQAKGGLCPTWQSYAGLPAREALIKSLFAFILEFLCNVRNGLTRIASYLRKPMTK
jgi:hypothetical protein